MPDDDALPDDEKFLEAEKQRLYEEIRNYPTPIAGCDQQFNYLLEQQAQVAARLNRLRAAIVAGGKSQQRLDPHRQHSHE